MTTTVIFHTRREYQPRVTEKVQRLIKALLWAAEEHGVPNSFSPGWLHTVHCAPAPFEIGRMVRTNFWDLRDAAASALEPFTFQYVRGERGFESRFECEPLARSTEGRDPGGEG